MALLGLLIWGVFAFLLFLLLTVTYTLHQRREYFKKHGIPYLGAGLSRTFKFFSGSLNLVFAELDIYREACKINAPIVGASDTFGSKNLYVTDLSLVRNIYVKDFEHFVNRRGVGTESANKYLKRMLFAMQDDHWKGIRTLLSPTLTTGKIRRMFEIFKKSGERMDTYVKAQIPNGAKSVDLDFTQIFPKYSMDVIASCAFGIDSHSFEFPPDQQSTFERMGKQFQFQLNLKTVLKFLLLACAPKVMDLLGLDAMDYESTCYFENVVRGVMKRRRQTGERSNDFLQLMMDAQEGLVKADEETTQVMNGSVDGGGEGGKLDGGQAKVTFDDDDIIANGFVFFLGGFDPTQSVMNFTVYSLALNQDVQEKLYEEVRGLMDKHGGELKYEAILEMTYLDMVINETMRLYPPTAKNERTCTKDYKVPGTNFVIEKDSIISIPVHAFHHDERYFPEPEKFIPERFSPENKAARHPYVFMPFGHGPRNCIGLRFALVKVKTAIAQLVGSYHLSPCSRTTTKMEFGNNANLAPKHGMWICATPRN